MFVLGPAHERGRAAASLLEHRGRPQVFLAGAAT